MAIIGINLEATRKFTPSTDPDKGTDKATVFEYGTLPSGLVGHIMDSIMEFSQSIMETKKEGKEEKGKTTVHIPLNRSALLFTKYGLRGWSNFPDEKGNAIKFETVSEHISGIGAVQVVKEELLNRIPFEIIRELAEKINGDNEVGKEEEKNSPKRSSR